MDGFEIITLKSGVKSLRWLENRETFHPVTGPKIEAHLLHVEQQRLVERYTAAREKLVVWDVGFGAAANALAAVGALRSCPGSAEVEIHSFDQTLAPAEFALSHAEELGYLVGSEEILRRLIVERRLRLARHLQWHLHLGDFGQLLTTAELPAPHAILYDPYSPSRNPAMWSLQHFTQLRSRMSPDSPCLLTNYSRSTAVRVTLLLAGFYVGIGCGVGEKNETTIASNQMGMLNQPLNASWLSRVRASSNSAPLTNSTIYSKTGISNEDYLRLCSLPQFKSEARQNS